MIEADFSKFIIKKMAEFNVFGVRVENSVGVGTPDLHYCFIGEFETDEGDILKGKFSGWIELKAKDRMAKNTVDLGMRPAQVNWMKKYPGDSWVLILLGTRLYLVWGGKADQLLGSISIDELEELSILKDNYDFETMSRNDWESFLTETLLTDRWPVH